MNYSELFFVVGRGTATYDGVSASHYWATVTDHEFHPTLPVGNSKCGSGTSNNPSEVQDAVHHALPTNWERTWGEGKVLVSSSIVLPLLVLQHPTEVCNAHMGFIEEEKPGKRLNVFLYEASAYSSQKMAIERFTFCIP